MHLSVLNIWSCLALCVMISSCASRAHLGRETGVSEASPESFSPIAYRVYEQGRAKGVDDSQRNNVVERSTRDRVIRAENSHDRVKDEIDQEAKFSENQQTVREAKPMDGPVVKLFTFIVNFFGVMLMTAAGPYLYEQGLPTKPQQ